MLENQPFCPVPLWTVLRNPKDLCIHIIPYYPTIVGIPYGSTGHLYSFKYLQSFKISHVLKRPSSYALDVGMGQINMADSGHIVEITVVNLSDVVM